jgi:uncharacterized delta-60 repeat protein
MSPNENPVFSPARIIQVHALLLFALIFCQTAFSGVVDTSFGTGGRFTTGYSIGGGPESTFGRDIYVQPEGRIVAFGVHTSEGFYSITLTGLTPDGSLDNTFGTGGKIILFDPNGNPNRYYIDSEMLPDGKFLLLSNTWQVSSDQSPSLVRLNKDGSLDPTFSADIRVASGSNTALKMAVLGDGKIYAMVSAPAPYLIRLNPDGSRDTSFGTGGVKLLEGRLRSTGPVIDLQTTPENKIVIAYANGTLIRFLANGDQDRSFGNQGVAKLYTSYIFNFRLNKMLIQPDEKVLLLGSVGGQENTALFRFNRRGKLDGSFGTAGVVISDFTYNEDDFAWSGILLNDGKILICGEATAPLQSGYNFLVAKYGADGTLEASTINGFFASNYSWGTLGIAIQPDGKILVQGDTQVPYITTGIIRYRDIRNGESTIRRPYDFDGDGLTDRSVYRQDPTNAAQSFWDVSISSNNSVHTFFGLNGDVPVPSDFNDDGKTDLAVFRPGAGAWFYTTDINSADYETVFFGQPGDIPFTNDYDGDSKADFAVFRPSTATWHIRNISDGSIRSVQFGEAKDKPLTGDFDGDSKADLAVWRSSDAAFYVLKSSDGQVLTRQLGTSADIPVTSDFDGDAKTDFGIFDPGTGRWSYYKSLTGELINIDHGASGDIPVPGDYDGDGKNDVAVFRPSAMTWLVKRSNNGIIDTDVFGQPMDIPLPGR